MATTRPIERVPDLCMIALFQQMTPQDALTATTVCRRWADLVPVANLRRRRFLAILVKSPVSPPNRSTPIPESRALQMGILPSDGPQLSLPRPISKFNTLQFVELSMETALDIATVFPGVKELQVYFGDSRSPRLAELEMLLARLSPQLISLHLQTGPNWISDDGVARLAMIVSEMTELKRLFINIESNNFPDLPIIARLDELVVDTYDEKGFFTSIARYCPADSASPKIYFKSHRPEQTVIRQFTHEVRPRVYSRFSRVELYGAAPVRAFEQFLGIFRSLTSVSLDPRETSLRNLFEEISHLSALVHLHLLIDFRTRGRIQSDPTPHLLPPQLKSIRSLKIEPKMFSHADMQRLRLSWTMPNLELAEFVLEGVRCYQCTEAGWSNTVTADSCLRQIFATLEGCTQLRALRHNFEVGVGTAEAILAK